MNIFKWIKWAFFENDEDGPCGPDRIMGEGPCDWKRKLKWWVRNPAHNFTHHVMGLYGKDFYSIEKWRKNNWSYTLRSYQGKKYPYLKYEGLFTFYFGWRNSGAFGVAFRPFYYLVAVVFIGYGAAKLLF